MVGKIPYKKEKMMGQNIFPVLFCAPPYLLSLPTVISSTAQFLKVMELQWIRSID
jgi:hypothetical protein